MSTGSVPISEYTMISSNNWIYIFLIINFPSLVACPFFVHNSCDLCLPWFESLHQSCTSWRCKLMLIFYTWALAVQLVVAYWLWLYFMNTVYTTWCIGSIFPLLSDLLILPLGLLCTLVQLRSGGTRPWEDPPPPPPGLCSKKVLCFEPGPGQEFHWLLLPEFNTLTVPPREAWQGTEYVDVIIFLVVLYCYIIVLKEKFITYCIKCVNPSFSLSQLKNTCF
jgi:hypothetical protein